MCVCDRELEYKLLILSVVVVSMHRVEPMV